jgi:vacuolar-type H+-ATPase subunit I/STV1
MPEMNWNKFAGMVAAFDDKEEGNGQAALHMLRAMLKTRGMKFVEAIEAEEYKKCVWEKLRPEGLREFMEWKRSGGNRNDADAARLRSRIAQLESELAETQRALVERERDGAELARALKDQEGVIAALRRELKTVRDRVGSEKNVHDISAERDRMRAALKERDDVIAALRGEMKNIYERTRWESDEMQRRVNERERVNNELRAELKRMNDRFELCGRCEVKRRILGIIAGLPILFFVFQHSPWQESSLQENLCKVLMGAGPLLAVFIRWRWMLFKLRYSWVSRRDNDIFRAIAAKWNGFLQRISLN